MAFNRIQHNKNKLIKALESNLGIITKACVDVGIDRGTFYNYYNKDKEFAKKVDEIQEVVLDFVESQLYRNIKAGDTTSTIFYLKCKGRKRGYIDKQEIQHSGEINTSTGLEGKTIEELLQLAEKLKD